MQITTVLFDADGVFQWPRGNRRELWVTLLGGREDAVDEFFADLLGLERTCYCGDRDFVSGVPAVIEKWKCAGAIDDLLTAWTAIEADPEALGIIRKLRSAGVTCCLATNQEPHRRTYMSSTLNYAALFDHQFYSCEVGFHKPDPRYFTAILERLDLDPSQVLFIDDRDDNVRAATSVGIRSEQFVPPSGTRPVEEMRRILSRYEFVEKCCS